MNKFDLVKIKEVNKSHEAMGLNLADYEGLVWDDLGCEVKVLFLNKTHRGDVAVVKFKKEELMVLQEASGEWREFFCKNVPKIDFKGTKLTPINFKDLDAVELIKDKPRYEKYGIKKGMIGMVIADYAIRGEILVDFDGQGLLESAQPISVRLEDLKKI